MSIRAYPIKKKYVKTPAGLEIHRITLPGNSFNLWGLTEKEETILWSTNFFDSLNEDCSGFTELKTDDIEAMKEQAKTLKYHGDLISVIEEDMKTQGDGDYIEYQCF